VRGVLPECLVSLVVVRSAKRNAKLLSRDYRLCVNYTAVYFVVFVNALPIVSSYFSEYYLLQGQDRITASLTLRDGVFAGFILTDISDVATCSDTYS
jgi:hypothetical protein